MPRRVAGLLLASGLPLIVAGCAEYRAPGGGTMLGTAPPLSWSYPVGPPRPGAAASTAGIGAPLQEPAPAADLSGRYTGTAVVTFNQGHAADCHDYRVSGFTVSGRDARFFGFRGTISPAGEVVMQASDKWISGRFAGRTFYGQLWRRYPACTWNLRLSAG